MTATIQNDVLTVAIAKARAELTSIQLKEDFAEYFSQAKLLYWKRHTPILFPIVGRLVDNTGQAYELPQHGITREYTITIG